MSFGIAMNASYVFIPTTIIQLNTDTLLLLPFNILENILSKFLSQETIIEKKHFHQFLILSVWTMTCHNKIST
jgi:hypothetical protein